MEKVHQKLEKKKELGRCNLTFQSPDHIPAEEYPINIFDSVNKGVRIGSIEILFEFIHSKVPYNFNLLICFFLQNHFFFNNK